MFSFLPHPTNRVWTRDSGPIFVRRESRRGATCRGCSHGMALQRLGQVQRLEARRAGRGRNLRSACAFPCGNPRSMWTRAAPGRARGRQHRRERSRHTHHNRRVPAERRAAAQSRSVARGTRDDLSPIPRHREGHLAGERHRRRRHARARGRHRALRRAAHRGHRVRTRPRRPQPRDVARKLRG